VENPVRVDIFAYTLSGATAMKKRFSEEQIIGALKEAGHEPTVAAIR
jgi:hypothetical protein